MSKPKLLLAGPLPPPYSGQEKITEIILNSKIAKYFELVHVDSSNKQQGNQDRGTLKLVNIFGTLKVSWQLFNKLSRNEIQVASIPLSANRLGFVKYMFMILPCLLFKTQVISVMGGSHFNKFFRSQPKIFQFFINSTIRHIDCIIVRGNNQKEQFSGIYHGELETVYCPSVSPIAQRKEVNLSDKKQINILFLSIVSQAKGAFDLIKAIPQLLKANNRLFFHFVGDKTTKERNITYIKSYNFDAQDFIVKNNIQNKVKFYGCIKSKNKEDMFKKADIFVFPSYSEGFPFAVIEAMEHRLPVISTRVGALPEVFKHEKEIYFIPKNSPQKIKDAVLELINNPKLVKKMTENSIIVLKSKLNIHKFEGRMIDIFKKQCGSG